MSFLLTDTFDDVVVWNGIRYTIDMSFDNILRMFEMFDDDMLEEFEKPVIALEMLIDQELTEIKSYEEGLLLFKGLMKEFLEIDLDKEQKEVSKEDKEDKEDDDEHIPKVYDYKKDAEIIYASFMSVYNMDLFEQHGKLHWKKFNALLSHIDDESKFKQVIGFRTMKIPTTKEASQEYISHVRRMKQIYSLDDRSAEEKMNSAFDSLSRVFKGK